tara:strand:+ start:119 stop:349 length:231 start_codon:yes stop_codon:yes gene_type:complete
MLYYILGGIGLSVIVPLTLFELGKCHMKRELRKNIVELEKIKESSNEDLSALIEIHFEELKKIDKGLLEFSKNKNL